MGAALLGSLVKERYGREAAGTQGSLPPSGSAAFGYSPLSRKQLSGGSWGTTKRKPGSSRFFLPILLPSFPLLG